MKEVSIMFTINTNPLQNVYVSEAFPDTNFNMSPYLYISRFMGTGDIYRTLMQFDVAYAIPKESTINSANLQLNVLRNEITSGSITLSVFRLYEYYNAYAVTWNAQPQVPDTADATASIASGFLGNLNVDVTDLVRGWYDGSIVNNGILLTGDELNSAIVGFASTSHPDCDLWPKLVINYVKGIQTVYPAETFYVPSGAPVFSTPINIEGTKKEVTFFVRNNGPALLDTYVQVSTDGINYYWSNASTQNVTGDDWGIAISINQTANWARVSLNGNGGETNATVSAVTWEG